jgi:hypothetical protein
VIEKYLNVANNLYFDGPWFKTNDRVIIDSNNFAYIQERVIVNDTLKSK